MVAISRGIHLAQRFGILQTIRFMFTLAAILQLICIATLSNLTEQITFKQAILDKHLRRWISCFIIRNNSLSCHPILTKPSTSGVDATKLRCKFNPSGITFFFFLVSTIFTFEMLIQEKKRFNLRFIEVNLKLSY